MLSGKFFVQVEETGMNHDLRPLSLLLNDRFTVLNAELNHEQFPKCKYSKRLSFLPQTGYKFYPARMSQFV
jgi:hypothetical protein